MNINEIKYLLGKANIRFIDIDKQFGLREGATRFACSKPHKAGEEALSKVLNIPLQILFPERYNEKGKRLNPQPVKNYTYKKMCEHGVGGNA